MNPVPEQGLTPHAKIAGAFGIGFGFFAGAGVTGLSMLIGIMGLWALVYGFGSAGQPLRVALVQGLGKRWLTWLAFLAFVLWVMVTAAWSPAPKLAEESIRSLGSMFILVPLAIWGTMSHGEADQLMARRALLAGLGIALFLLFFETISGAATNKVASPEKEPLAIAGDLGRAATATLSLFWIGFACLKRDNYEAKVLTGFVAISILVAFQFGTDLNGVGLVIGTFAALLALAIPRTAISILTAGCAGAMISAPLLYPFLAKVAVAVVPAGQMPMSYGRRAQMWNLSAELIAQNPLAGWGLGAGSTFGKVVRYEGFDWAEIQRHPHAAPLHIWLETGAIGAVLASIAIIFAGGAAVSTFGRHKAAASALVGGLAFLAVQWALSHSAWRDWMWTSFAAVIAFSLALRDDRSKQEVLLEDNI